MTELAEELASHKSWEWREGMRDTAGRRIVDVELHSGEGLPDLADFATAGIMLGMLDELGRLTDVVKESDWIVAVELHTGLQGYGCDTLGQAAAYALLAVWDEPEA